MRHGPGPNPPPSEITPREVYLVGRRLLKGLAGLARVAAAAPDSAAVLACVHFSWQVKAGWREPAIYAVLLAVLPGWRLLRWRRRTVAVRVARPAG